MEKIGLKDFIKLSKDDLEGKIFIFPTDTVYGVGALYEDFVGKEKIYQMKKRDYGKPLPVLFSTVSDVLKVCKVKDEYKKYFSYWPGALTVILNKLDSQSTLACRIPNSNVSLEILSTFGPMYVTSVNYSGEKELNDIDEIYNTFKDCCDYLITDKVTLSKTPSTIISLVDDFKIIRDGGIKF